MIYLITGTTHTGKTNLAQKLLEKYQYPYLSIDHLKMGLIRSNHTNLTPYSSDNELTNYLWPIVLEIIKTNIENNQNLIIEGCYIPINYKDYFNEDYLKQIKYCCLIMTEDYIKNNYPDIIKYSTVIEKRIEEELDIKSLIEDNNKNLELVLKHHLNYVLIKDEYNIDIDNLFK